MLKIISGILLLAIINSCNSYDPSLFSDETAWSNSFECNSIENCIEQVTIDGSYTRYLPVENKWTYGTLQPVGSTLELKTHSGTDKKYLDCYTPSASGDLTSKAQIARKFPPYGILENYDGLTAIHNGDIITISMKLFIDSINLHDGRITFLDIEDSTSGNAGIRFLMLNNTQIGINRDKIMNKDTILYADTAIPTDDWFLFETEVLISEKGHYKIWINDEIVLDKEGMSFIDKLDFYDSVMVGITGTLASEPSRIQVDDFKIKVQRGTKLIAATVGLH